MKEAQHRLLLHGAISLSHAIDLFVMEDVFRKETQKIVGSFSNAKKAPKWKTSTAANKEWAEARAACDIKGSYSEQDK